MMTKIKSILLSGIIAFIPVLFLTDCSRTGTVSIGNKSLQLSFDTQTGRLISFYDVTENRELLDTVYSRPELWTIHLKDGSGLSLEQPAKVRILKEGRSGLGIQWSFPDNDIKIVATVRLDDAKPLSYWGISMSGIREKQIADIQFPIVSGLRNLEGQKLAASTWLGNLIDNPEGIYTWSSPGSLSLQLLALYGKDGTGLYFASNDTQSCTKNFKLSIDKSSTAYSMVNFLPQDDSQDSYSPDYQCIVGCFNGDWITAAQIYREWAVQQKWCQDSRLKNRKIPSWLTETSCWVWNRGRSENVLPEAVDLQNRIGLPVNVFWHWWHNCSYDEGFPEYLPPREGRAPFIEAVAKAQAQGVHCIVYMNSFQWGTATESFSKEGADRYCARTADGSTYSHVFNIFTGNALTPMCMGTDFWQNKYASLCDSVINHYGVDGVYMDQACMNYRCYDPTHGHTIGGGNYWLEGFADLTSKIRSCTSNVPTVLGGEGSGEDWIPYLDLFLTLEASRERYVGIGNFQPIPIFQAVYHDYAITYGNYSSLVYPPYDERWPDQYRPANRETTLPALFNKQFRMEQARTFVWGLQPTIANYHAFLANQSPEELKFFSNLVKTRYKALKYLLHGKYVRAPEIQAPTEKIDLSKISIYAGKLGNSVTQLNAMRPTLYAGAWMSEDGSLAIAVANIADTVTPVNFILKLHEYELPDQCAAYLITEEDRIPLGETKDGEIEIAVDAKPCNCFIVEILPKG